MTFWLKKWLSGRRPGSGAPPGNVNAQKSIELPDWLRLDDAPSILKFVREILIPSTLGGKIGSRASSTVATCCKLLLEHDDDLRHLQEVSEKLDRLELEDQELTEELSKLRAMKHASVTEDSGIEPPELDAPLELDEPPALDNESPIDTDADAGSKTDASTSSIRGKAPRRTVLTSNNHHAHARTIK